MLLQKNTAYGLADCRLEGQTKNSRATKKSRARNAVKDKVNKIQQKCDCNYSFVEKMVWLANQKRHYLFTVTNSSNFKNMVMNLDSEEFI